MFPHSDEDDCDKNIDSEDDFDLGQADLDDKDSGLTYGKVQTHQVIVEDLGEDLEADLNDSTIDDDHVEETTVNNGTQLPQTVDSNPIARDRDSRSTTEGEQVNDDGSWLFDLIDLSGLEDWPSELQNKAKEMLARNAGIFSKHDLDMSRTDLVQHNIIFTNPLPFKEKFRRIPPQLYDEVKAHLKEMLDLGAIRHSNSPWASAIFVWLEKKMASSDFVLT